MHRVPVSVVHSSGNTNTLSCKRCRKSHVKCDRGEPKCSRCAQSDSKCERVQHGPRRIKARLVDSTKHQPEFPVGQPWLNTRDTITFWRTEDPAAGENQENHESQTSCHGSLSEPLGTTQVTAFNGGSSPDKAASGALSPQRAPVAYTSDPPALGDIDQAMPDVSASQFYHSQVNHSTLLTPCVTATAVVDNVSDGMHPNLHTPESCNAPTLPEHEANLIQHFVTKLAPVLDICDPKRTFGRAVPRLAMTSPILLNALYAASSKHLSRTHKATDPPAEHYIQECLNHLIPLLSNAEVSVEDHLLVAVVILRFVEEMDIPLIGLDQQSHLPAVHALLSAQERQALNGGIRQAAFWVGFRQEMVVAFLNQRRIVPVLEHCNFDMTLSTTDEHMWTNRIIVHCADVITYCFGNGTLAESRYQALGRYAKDWIAHKPASFEVLYQYLPREGQFVHLCYAGDAVVAGIQHYHLSQIILAAHDPTVPRIGPQRKVREQLVNHKLRSHVRALCGIAQANDANAARWVCTCLGISLCGDRFTSRTEQQALLEILLQTERTYARHTSAIRAQLIEAWA